MIIPAQRVAGQAQPSPSKEVATDEVKFSKKKNKIFSYIKLVTFAGAIMGVVVIYLILKKYKKNKRIKEEEQPITSENGKRQTTLLETVKADEKNVNLKNDTTPLNQQESNSSDQANNKLTHGETVSESIISEHDIKNKVSSNKNVNLKNDTTPLYQQESNSSDQGNNKLTHGETVSESIISERDIKNKVSSNKREVAGSNDTSPQESLKVHDNLIDKSNPKLDHQPPPSFSIVGLENLGFTCYMNASIQILWAMIASLGEEAFEMVQSWPNLAGNSAEEAFTIALGELIIAIKEAGSNPDNPTILDKKYIKNLVATLENLNGNYTTNQESGQYFLGDTLGWINTALRKQEKKEENLAVFKKMATISYTLSATEGIPTVEAFKKRFLAYKKEVEAHQLSRFAQLYYSYHATAIHLPGEKAIFRKKYDFHHYSKILWVPRTDISNSIYDNFKHTPLQFEISEFKIMIAPSSILLFYVGGFSGTVKSGISYPIEKLKVVNGEEYDLAAAMIHSAWEPTSHYMTLIKDQVNNQWYETSDSHIRKVSDAYVGAPKIQTKYHGHPTKPMFLVYKKRDNPSKSMEERLTAYLIRQKLRRLEYRTDRSWVSNHQEMHQLWEVWQQNKQLDEETQKQLQILKKRLLTISSQEDSLVAQELQKLAKEKQAITPIFLRLKKLFQDKGYLQNDKIVDRLYGYLDLIDYVLYTTGQFRDTL